MNISTLRARVTSELPLLTLICYALGAVYSIAYFGYFHVPIIYYTALNDILLESVRTISFIALYIGIFHILFFDILGARMTKIHNKLFEKRILSKEQMYVKICDYAAILTMLFNIIITMRFLNFQQSIFIFYFAPMLTYWESKYKIDKEIRAVTSWSVIIFMVLYVGFLSYMSASFHTSKANKILISFQTELDTIDTSKAKNLFYIGETTNNIFIYDTISRNTKVFNKSDAKRLSYFSN